MESNWVHSASRKPIYLFYLPQVIMIMDNLVEWQFPGETEVLGEILPQFNFVYHKSHMSWPGANPDRCDVKPGANRLSYSTAFVVLNTVQIAQPGVLTTSLALSSTHSILRQWI
jgi:hypothetical protein